MEKIRESGSAFFTSSEVAEYLGVCIETVRRYNRSGMLSGYQFAPASELRFRCEDVRAFLAAAKARASEKGEFIKAKGGG